jgi:hypothetical protein
LVESLLAFTNLSNVWLTFYEEVIARAFEFAGVFLFLSEDTDFLCFYSFFTVVFWHGVFEVISSS